MSRTWSRVLEWWCASPLLRLIVLVAIVVALAMLAGCVSAPPPRTQVLTVERKFYVPVDPALTAPCAIAGKQDVTLPDTAQLVLGGMTAPAAYWFAQFAQAAGVAKLRKTSLEKCNADKAAIRAIQGTPTHNGEGQ